MSFAYLYVAFYVRFPFFTFFELLKLNLLSKLWCFWMKSSQLIPWNYFRQFFLYIFLTYGCVLNILDTPVLCVWKHKAKKNRSTARRSTCSLLVLSVKRYVTSLLVCACAYAFAWARSLSLCFWEGWVRGWGNVLRHELSFFFFVSHRYVVHDVFNGQ